MPSQYISFLLFVFLVFSQNLAFSQNETQTIRGMVIDRQTKTPVIGARVELTNFVPPRALYTNEYGRFRFSDIPLGRHRILVKASGYRPLMIADLELRAGAEINLVLNLEEQGKELDRKGSGNSDKSETVLVSNKDFANNEMELTTTRILSTNEANRFAGDRNEISRLIGNYAGVQVRNDHYDHLSLRGNSPAFMQWRLEGLPIAQPSHLGELGSNGGQFNILNPYVLENSDLLLTTPNAEYSGFLSGVFDVRLRKGNNERFQFLGQVSSINGMQFVVEGPFSKKQKASYLISARYTSRGVSYGRSALEQLMTGGQEYLLPTSFPVAADLLWNFYFPDTKWGNFSFFGLFGLAWQDLDGRQAAATQHDNLLQANKFEEWNSQMGMFGLKHFIHLNESKKTYLKSSLASNYSSFIRDRKHYEQSSPQPVFSVNYLQRTLYLKSIINHRQSLAWSYRGGILVKAKLMDLASMFRQEVPNEPRNFTYTPDKNFITQAVLLQTFGQASYRPNEALNIVGGVSFQYFNLNSTYRIEPRFNLSYRPSSKHIFNLGFGSYGQVLPPQIYAVLGSNGVGLPNFNLPMAQSDNLNLGYTWAFKQDWRLRIEAYGQIYFDLIIDTINPANNILHFANGMIEGNSRHFSPQGLGQVYGLDLTLEKFFSNNFYLINTLSYTSSQARGIDGNWYLTPFDVGLYGNLLFGREFALGQGNTLLTFDVKSRFGQGQKVYEVNEAASRRLGYTIYDEQRLLSQTLPWYWRLDLRLGLIFNSRSSKIGHRLYIDVLNVLNRGNRTFPIYDHSREMVINRENFPTYLDLLYQFRF